ncbi:MAG: hypothetical protein QNK17_02440, partial [Hyphomicrobiaceae bacterium]|nr:hypothetical protein [Hyphomicrobiaceae bacterium]
MKRIRTHKLPLLLVLACFSPGFAEAKSSVAPLPDRNPERPAPIVEQATTTPDARPAVQEPAPAAAKPAPVETVPTEVASTTPSTAPAPAASSTTMAAIPAPVLNPDKPATENVAAPEATVTPAAAAIVDEAEEPES